MARPRKDNADYFSHDTNMRSHRKIIALRSKYGLIGYAIYCMILEHIGSCDFFTSKRDEIEQEIIAGDFGIPVADLIDTVSFCDRLNLLQIEGENLKCQSLTNRLKDLIDKRYRERNRVPVAETTQTVAESPQSKVKESKVKESKEINNTTKVVLATPESFGDPEINSLLEKIKVYNNGIIDGTIKEQRQYGKQLLTKLKQIESVKNDKYSATGLLEIILKIISKSDYHSHKIVGPKKIYYELAGLMQVCKQEFQKEESNKIPFIPGI